MVMLVLLMACLNFDPRSYVDKIRVMAIQSVPAEITPSDGEAKLNIVIADPQNEGVELLLWTCTDLGSGCIEADFYEDTRSWGQYITMEGFTASATVPIPPELAFVLPELPEELIPFRNTSVWVLACHLGTCPGIAAFQEGTLEKSYFKKPEKLIEELGFGSASLANRSLLISQREESLRVQNPILERQGEGEVQVSANGTLDISFSYTRNNPEEGTAFLYGYTTSGSIIEGQETFSEVFDEQGETIRTWQAGEVAQEAQLFFVFDNGAGGLDFWYSQAQVQ